MPWPLYTPIGHFGSNLVRSTSWVTLEPRWPLRALQGASLTLTQVASQAGVGRPVGAPQADAGPQENEAGAPQGVAADEGAQREQGPVRVGTGAAVPCHTDPCAVQGKPRLALEETTQGIQAWQFLFYFVLPW